VKSDRSKLVIVSEGPAVCDTIIRRIQGHFEVRSKKSIHPSKSTRFLEEKKTTHERILNTHDTIEYIRLGADTPANLVFVRFGIVRHRENPTIAGSQGGSR
jgi:hypothetical protein